MKKISGFSAYVILNNDGENLLLPKSRVLYRYTTQIRRTIEIFTGIVIKYENMSYRIAVHHAHLILSLYGKAIKYARDLFDPPDVSEAMP